MAGDQPNDVRERLARFEASLSPVTINDHLLSEIKTIRQIMDERHQLYATQFKSAETAVNAALIAQKSAVDAAFSASEKAITKAEDAQREYNVRSNEFRGQLDDQAKTLMPRPETSSMFRAVEDKMVSMQKNTDEKTAVLMAYITELQLSKAELHGKASQSSVTNAYIISAIGLAAGITGIALRFFGN